MIGVTITVENGTTLATVSDADGNFFINNVPVGRHSVRASYIGYEPVLLKEQLVSSGKELVLTLRMRESISELGEVVIKPRVNKQLPLNEMAQVGARMFSVEEATRYAGGMADPARTASMFAGVAFEAYEATFPQKEKAFQAGQLPQFCQSCGMPLTRIEDCGTNADGSTSFDYCQYCYKDGKFLQECAGYP